LDPGTKLFLGNDLRFVETRLRTIIDILESNSSNPTLLYSIRNNIDSETRDKILQTVEAMLNEIRQIKEEFGLEPTVESLKRKIDIDLDEIWTTLLDTRPEKMHGRSKMSRPDEDSVRSYVLKLLKMVEHLLFNKPI
jgi:DNA-directed RNA polymerase specialized sigma subunit